MARQCKRLLINFGDGSLENGIRLISAQLFESGELKLKREGYLPATPGLAEAYQNWQKLYFGILDYQTKLQVPVSTRTLKFQAGSSSFGLEIEKIEPNRQALVLQLDQWLSCEGFAQLIEKDLRSSLNREDDIEVILETHDEGLRKLPWHQWQFFQDYPHAEIAYSKRVYGQPLLSSSHKKIRILAILGEVKGIDLDAERRYLEQLSKQLSNVEILFLESPTREKLFDELWNQEGFDILFFAGHSRTVRKTGELVINENTDDTSVTIAEFKQAFKKSLERGVQLAIFNSCDGLGIAENLAEFGAAQIIVMREPVMNRVAQEFFREFLEAFAMEQLPLYRAMRQARSKLEKLENRYPGATWLPMLFHNPTTSTLNWQLLGGKAQCPYRGLFAFQEKDEDFFFGRETFVEQLWTAVTVERKSLVAVIGASGSGKSSVVFAGLAPELRKDKEYRWNLISFRPGKNPYASFAKALAPILYGLDQISQKPNKEFHLKLLELENSLQNKQYALYDILDSLITASKFKEKFLFIVDQWEEIYTLASDEKVDIEKFILNLLEAVKCIPKFSLVLTLRADFLDCAVKNRLFSDALQNNTLLLGSMNKAELNKAILEPARKLNVELESGLAERLLEAVGKQAESLPLLEFALTQLWQRSKHGILTHQDYLTIGSLRQSLANHAENIYNKLDKQQQKEAQKVFTKLVRPGNGSADTRSIEALLNFGRESISLINLLNSEQARLIVINYNKSNAEETVELVHEALILGWDRLKQWINMNREFRLWQERLKSSILLWEKNEREEEGLLTGLFLEESKKHFNQKEEYLSATEIDYVKQSILKKKTIDQENKQKRKRRFFLLLTSSIVGLSLAVFAGVGWFINYRDAQNANLITRSLNIRDLLKVDDSLGVQEKALRLAYDLNRLGSNTKLETKISVWNTLSLLNTRLYRHYKIIDSPQILSRVENRSDDLILESNEKREIQVKIEKKKKKYTRKDQNMPIVSHSGRLKVEFNSNNTISIVHTDGSLISTIKGSRREIEEVVFSPNDKYVALVNTDNPGLRNRSRVIEVWSVDGKYISSPWKDSKHAVFGKPYFTSDNTKILSREIGASNVGIHISSIDGSSQSKAIGDRGGNSASLFIMPDGSFFASIDGKGVGTLWDMNGEKYLEVNADGTGVYKVIYSKNRNLIGFIGNNNKIYIYKKQSLGISDVDFNPSGKFISASYDENKIHLFNTPKNHFIDLELTNFEISAIHVSSYSQKIAVLGEKCGKVKIIRKNIRNDFPKKHSNQLDSHVPQLESQKRTVPSVCAVAYTLLILDYHGNLLQSINTHNSVPGLSSMSHGFYQSYRNDIVVFSPNSKLIAAALTPTERTSSGARIAVWEIGGNGKNLFENQDFLKQDKYIPISDIAFTKDSTRLLITQGDPARGTSGGRFRIGGRASIWTVEGKLLKNLAGHTDGVLRIYSNHPTGLLATSSLDGTIRLWSSDGSLINVLNGDKLAFSRSNNFIVTTQYNYGNNVSSIQYWTIDGELMDSYKISNFRIRPISVSDEEIYLYATSRNHDSTDADFIWRQSIDEAFIYNCQWIESYLKKSKTQSTAKRICHGHL